MAIQNRDMLVLENNLNNCKICNLYYHHETKVLIAFFDKINSVSPNKSFLITARECLGYYNTRVLKINQVLIEQKYKPYPKLTLEEIISHLNRCNSSAKHSLLSHFNFCAEMSNNLKDKIYQLENELMDDEDNEEYFKKGQYYNSMLTTYINLQIKLKKSIE